MRVRARAPHPPLGRALRGRGEELSPAACPHPRGWGRGQSPRNRYLAGGGQERLGLAAGWTGWTVVCAEDRDEGGGGSRLLPDVGAPAPLLQGPVYAGCTAPPTMGSPASCWAVWGRGDMTPGPGTQGNPSTPGASQAWGPSALEVTMGPPGEAGQPRWVKVCLSVWGTSVSPSQAGLVTGPLPSCGSRRYSVWRAGPGEGTLGPRVLSKPRLRHQRSDGL